MGISQSSVLIAQSSGRFAPRFGTKTELLSEN